MSAAERTKDRSNLLQHWEGRVLGLSSATSRKVLSDRPALKPDWRKPTVRNFRGGGWKRLVPRHPPTRAESGNAETAKPFPKVARAVPLSRPIGFLPESGGPPCVCKIRRGLLGSAEPSLNA